MYDTRLEEHLGRLFTLVDSGVIDQPPAEQLRKILRDAAAALGCVYAEVSGSTGTLALGVHDEDAAFSTIPLGVRAADADRPLMVLDAQDDPIATAPAVIRYSLRAVAFWPVVAGSQRWVLTFGWASNRVDQLSDEEKQYIDFLSAVLSRLLIAAERHRQLNERVQVDPLTGLLNRTATLEHISQALSAAKRSGGAAALLYIDLDRFKEINDTYGHAAGDTALAEIAKRMRTVVRKHEYAGRLGGDEFAVVLPAYADDAELEGVATRLIAAIAAPIENKFGTVQVSASIGIAQTPRDASSVQDLIACADRAMYKAKAERNSFAFYSGGSRAAQTSGNRSAFPSDLQSFDAQFVFCVQPIVDARTGRPVGGELLPRWLHPELGLQLPTRFLNGSTDDESLHLFERLMLWTAVKKAAAFASEHGLQQLFVNVSRPRAELLEIPPSGGTVCLEIKEDALAKNPEPFIDFAIAARERGYRIGLADFAGDTPLRALAQAHFDFVKIHARQFREKTWNVRSAKALKTLVDQAHTMGCTVLAEAVETETEMDLLLASGVDALQGFKICSPLTERDFANWMLYRASPS